MNGGQRAAEQAQRPLDDDQATTELVRRYAEATRALGSWKHEREHVRELLIKVFGADHVGQWRGTVRGQDAIKISVRTTRRFDVAAMRADHPDLYDRYLTALDVAVVTVDGGAL